MGYAYEQAIEECAMNGEELIKLENFQEALDLYNSSLLNSGTRLDAVSNETCFKDQLGEVVDPEQHGFDIDIMLPENIYGLSVDDDGIISMVNASDDVLMTVCQFGDIENGGDNGMNVEEVIIPNVSQRVKISLNQNIKNQSNAIKMKRGIKKNGYLVPFVFGTLCITPFILIFFRLTSLNLPLRMITPTM